MGDRIGIELGKRLRQLRVQRDLRRLNSPSLPASLSKRSRTLNGDKRSRAFKPWRKSARSWT